MKVTKRWDEPPSLLVKHRFERGSDDNSGSPDESGIEHRPHDFAPHVAGGGQRTLGSTTLTNQAGSGPFEQFGCNRPFDKIPGHYEQLPVASIEFGSSIRASSESKRDAAAICSAGMLCLSERYDGYVPNMISRMMTTTISSPMLKAGLTTLPPEKRIPVFVK